MRQVFHACVCPVIGHEFRHNIAKVAPDVRQIFHACVCPVIGHEFRHNIAKVAVDLLHIALKFTLQS